ITRFLQQSASSAVLNRVITQNPSSILGALQSNGRVFLINPNGIVFGAGAQIDVAGLVASTLNLSNADFLAGRLKFTEVPGAGSLVNQGTINAAQGGQVYLVGPSVKNEGLITSPKGEVILAAGNTVELVNPGTPNLRVEVAAADNEARNLGQIVADAGRVGIYAGLINHSGTIGADSAQVTEDGRIVLKATRNATLEAGSLTTANGPNGGSVTVQSGDTTLVSGTIEAKGLASPPSQGGVAHSAGAARSTSSVTRSA
ncbi:MAG: filamentous hemagglutinin N-terminal domain-containing protein, partial [Betaproteobacteria bacterium]|nr:filamentous hemagglutinin N-terminal domain-containing protein [Betaproteobacteria bacterium]